MKLSATKISQIIDEFERSQHIDLPRLLEMARVLACQSYWYADALGEVSKAYRRAYVARKRLFAELQANGLAGGKSAAKAKAEAEADENYLILAEAEADAEGRKEHGRTMYGAICNVLDRMNQEIAEARKEREYTRHTDGNIQGAMS